MTCAMMNEFGCGVQQAGDGCWAVPRCGYNQISNAAGNGAQDYSSSSSPSPRPPRHTSTYAIEPDASSATYFLAMAAVTGAVLARVRVDRLSAGCLSRYNARMLRH